MYKYKGNPLNPENDRQITLISCLSKLEEPLKVIWRMSPFSEKAIRDLEKAIQH